MPDMFKNSPNAQTPIVQNPSGGIAPQIYENANKLVTAFEKSTGFKTRVAGKLDSGRIIFILSPDADNFQASEISRVITRVIDKSILSDHDVSVDTGKNTSFAALSNNLTSVTTALPNEIVINMPARIVLNNTTDIINGLKSDAFTMKIDIWNILKDSKLQNVKLTDTPHDFSKPAPATVISASSAQAKSTLI